MIKESAPPETKYFPSCETSMQLIYELWPIKGLPFG